MIKKSNEKQKRRIRFLSTMLIVVAFILVISVFGYWLQIINNKKLVKELNNEYATLLDSEKELTSQVLKFQDPDYIAKYARENYLYTKDGETIIRIAE